MKFAKVCASLMLLSTAGTAWAQSTTPAAAASPEVTAPETELDQANNATTQNDGPASRIEDITVLGRKRTRAEELQQTPLAITALSAAQLQRSVVRDMVDVGKLTPSAALQGGAQRGVQNFAIRGIGVSGASPSDEPAVGIFQDGVYWGTNYGGLNELLDVEGIEILRGPQGTLFGRNVTGGAVTLRSARPSQEAFGRVTVGISNGLGIDASAVVNSPVSDTLAVRLAAMSRHNNGLFTKLDTGKSYGKNSTYILRPSVKWTPSSDLDITLLGEYYHSGGDPQPVRGISPHTVGVANLAELAGYVTSPDFTDIQVGNNGFFNVDVYFGMGEINWNVGPGTLTSITGYRKVRSNSKTDMDGFPVNGFLYEILNEQDQFSEELRYAVDIGDAFSLTAGAYYFKQNFTYAETRDNNNHLIMNATRSTLDNESYAFFAEADIRPIDRLTVTLGGRYTKETKDPLAAPLGRCALGLEGPCTYTKGAQYSADNFSPKVGVSFQLDDHKMLFASWTRGFRSGGYSLRGTPLAPPYGAETVDAYEAGLKTDLFDRRVRFNLTGYMNTFDNLQRTILLTGGINDVVNAASAKIKGVEVELTVIPTTGLTLTGNYGYTHARYDSFTGFANPQRLRFVRVPEHTANLMADYEVEVNDRDKAAFHVGAAYTSRYFFDDANLLSQPGYWLMDANVSYTFDQNASLTLYMRNLTDKQYAVWGSTLGLLGQNAFPGDPRTYGARIAVTF